ncbi:MAG TPA: hypothetical protein PLM38_10990, partial [Ottowia sp.]|nr:hypothetical protein [Ottowia sp.]
VAAVPVLALQALRHELARLGHLAMQLAREATRLNPVALPWTAPVPQADVRLGRQLQSIEQLQLQIGKFVSETSRGAMHKEVATQLPELLRIATHFDTLARVMHHVGVQGNHTPRADESPGLSLLILPGMPERAPADAAPPGTDIVACVVPVFTAAEAFFAAADPEGPQQAQGGPWLAGEARAAFEEAYQTAKAALLHAGAGGGVDVNAVYDWLSRLSDLRRAVEQGYKASQRLAALPELSGQAEGGAAQPLGYPATGDGGASPGMESAE